MVVQHSHDDTFVDNHSVAPSVLLFQIIEAAVSIGTYHSSPIGSPILINKTKKKKTTISNNSCGVRLRGRVRILIQDKRCSTVLNIYQ